MPVGDKIKNLRKSLELPQKELASRASISQASLHYIENNVNIPKISTLEKIATALGVSVLDLLDESQAKASGE